MKRRTVYALVLLIGGLIISMVVVLRGWPRQTGAPEALLEQVEEFRLPNGMLWLLLRRGEAPVFTGVVQVRVGGIEEVPGKAGLAHMFEHMAFKGGPTIGTRDFDKESAVIAQLRENDVALRTAEASGDVAQVETLQARRTELTQAERAFVDSNEIWRLLHENGAVEINAYTSKDLTTYHARMPANALGLWLYINAEMVGHPVMREFYAERDVVMEERRTSVDNSPQGKLYEAMLQAAFVASPYRTMTIGSMAELQGLTIADAEAFFARYYHPERMVGAVVGNFDLAAAKTWIQEYFGALPAGSAPAQSFAAEPVPTEERRVTVAFDAEPMLMMAYHKPALPQQADYVFDAIQYLLCDAEAARLRHHVERELRVASGVHCRSGSPGSRLDNLFLISAQPLNGHTIEELIAGIETVLTQLRETLVAEADLATARTNLRASFLWGLNDNATLAQHLAYFQTVNQDWRYLVNHSQVMAGLTPEDVRATARQFLQPQQRTIAILQRPAAKEPL